MSSAVTIKQSRFVELRTAMHLWLWENTSDQKSVTDSYILDHKTFYNVRKFCFAIALMTWIMSQIDSIHATITNFQYLTEWGVDLTLAYFALSLLIMKNKEFSNKYWKTAHVIFELVYSAEFIITAMFWGAIYQTIEREKTYYYLTLTTLEHGGMFVLLIIDNIFNRIKFYKRHMIYLLGFLVFYFSVNLTVTLCYAPVYAVIDWKSNSSHLLALIALLSTVFHFVIARVIYEIFKKKRVEVVMTTDDYFFTDKPIQFQHINKVLGNRVFWWVLIITITLTISSTIATLDY